MKNMDKLPDRDMNYIKYTLYYDDEPFIFSYELIEVYELLELFKKYRPTVRMEVLNTNGKWIKLSDNIFQKMT
jgi:hypothetical protein